MDLKLENVQVLYHDEDTSVDRNFKFRIDPDETTLHIDISDEVKPAMTISLDKEELRLFIDSLNIFVKNKMLK